MKDILPAEEPFSRELQTAPNETLAAADTNLKDRRYRQNMAGSNVSNPPSCALDLSKLTGWIVEITTVRLHDPQECWQQHFPIGVCVDHIQPWKATSLSDF